MKSQKESTATESRSFKAEVKQVLDIVINSLYTHRDIFIRELVSNATDALEKMRHESLVQTNYNDKDAPFEIRVDTDKKKHTITITDTGVGMTHDELVNNLGTIAQSGTRGFVENLPEDTKLDSDIIGKFGVGFYSAFMSAEEVRVQTRSFKPTAKGYEWKSDGVGEYTITKIDDLSRGTSVIVKLKGDAYEYEDDDNVKRIIKKYSNFVPFPVLVNGEKINTAQAIWTKMPSEVTDSEYNEFFKFLSTSESEPTYRLHLTSDAPIQLSSILYVPASNLEQFGFMKLKPSVSLYCRKVLVEQNTDKLFPEYLRFIHGVVDSADLPLNISRETLQDNLVFRKIGKFLTKRILRFLEDEVSKDTEKYNKFWELFNRFIKEGVVTDFENRKELSGLLRFRSSFTDKDEYVSLADYTGRLKEGEETIYYINGRSREEIERGPYMEAFRKRGIEVLYLYEPYDDFVMTALMDYDGKKLVSADSANIELPPDDTGEKKDEPVLSPDDIKNLTQWMKDTLGDRVTEVRESKRYINRPAIIVNPDEAVTTTMQRIMKASDRDFGISGTKVLEINPDHEIITTLKKLRDGKSDKGFLQLCVEQIYDNALAESGLLEDPGTMVERVYSIMDRALKAEEKNS
ncbi:MAG: molecular chaperone HtpG [Candidatus Latescibacteria bacterium]|jgi:TNF receptor-associated protein 1|nr:molecular chaperone HtpG [Candidatus Latescibacterota bacterium]